VLRANMDGLVTKMQTSPNCRLRKRGLACFRKSIFLILSAYARQILILHGRNEKIDSR